MPLPSVRLVQPRPPRARLGNVYNDKEVTQAIAELIRLHDDVLARVFAMQTLLEDRDLISPEEIQRRTEEFRKQFAANLEARFAAHQEKTDTAAEIQRRQRILNENERRQR